VTMWFGSRKDWRVHFWEEFSPELYLWLMNLGYECDDDW
jgi:hypothetical protein